MIGRAYPRLPPLLGGHGCGAFGEAPLTDDDRQLALVKARETMGKLEGIRKELGLAPESLVEVVIAYENAMTDIVHEREHTKQRERRRKEKAWLKQNPGYAESNPLIGPAVGRYVSPLPPMPAFDDDDDE